MSGKALSQAEIDALLNSVLPGGPGGDGGDTKQAKPFEPEKTEEQKFKRYDFNSPRKFTKDKLRLLRGIHETYARVVSSRLNSILRTGCQVDIIDVEEQRFYEFTNSLMDNDVITLIDVTTEEGLSKEPLVMKIDTMVVLAMIDYMLGGTSDDSEDFYSYTYTDIELRIYQLIVKYMIDVMRDGWMNYLEDMGFELNKVESNPQMMQRISREESVAIVTMKIQVGTVQGKFHICLPDTVMSHVFAIMDRRSVLDGLSEEEKEATSKIIFDNIKKTSLEITAELGKCNLQLRDIYSLQVGDVINLNKAKDSEVYLNIADKTWFKGYLGTSNKNMAIKISDTL